ncbi:S1 family peptidase [Bosea sp. NPDC055594]
MTQIDQFSLVTVPIELLFEGRCIGHATSFIWHEMGRHFLVTNWHVLSGIDFFTLGNASSHGGRPDHIRAYFEAAPGMFGKRQWELPLFDDERVPYWLVYPLGKRADIAVLPLPEPELPMSMYPLNVLASDDLRVEIGMDVYILGYPFAIEPPALPVWKRGSIASEPELIRMTTNYMLVDSASRPGMSGSPVIRRDWGNGATKSLTKFIGIYSGRKRVEPDEAQIGLVWDASLIRDIIAGNTRDTRQT